MSIVFFTRSTSPESPPPVPKTPSAFRRLAQRNAFRRDARLRSPPKRQAGRRSDCALRPDASFKEIYLGSITRSHSHLNPPTTHAFCDACPNLIVEIGFLCGVWTPGVSRFSSGVH